MNSRSIFKLRAVAAPVVLFVAALSIQAQTATNIRHRDRCIRRRRRGCLRQCEKPRHGRSSHRDTDASGTYSIPNVPVGQYDITVEKEGFSALRFQNVQLTVAQNLTLNGSLAVGAVSQQVEVAGSSVPTLDLEDAQISNMVDQRRIVDLPLVTRDPYSLVLLSPGVQQTTSSLGGFSVNGQRERNNNFLLDGVDNNDASVPGIRGRHRVHQSGLHAGVPGHHKQLSARVWSKYRCNSRHRYAKRNQRLSRFGV